MAKKLPHCPYSPQSCNRRSAVLADKNKVKPADYQTPYHNELRSYELSSPRKQAGERLVRCRQVEHFADKNNSTTIRKQETRKRTVRTTIERNLILLFDKWRILLTRITIQKQETSKVLNSCSCSDMIKFSSSCL